MLKSRDWHLYPTVVADGGRRRSLGYFADPKDAARAYDAAALEHWGEFAYVNAYAHPDLIEVA